VYALVYLTAKPRADHPAGDQGLGGHGPSCQPQPL